MALGQPLLRAILLAEHTGCGETTTRSTNTRTTYTVFPVRFLMWDMPYHAEHHRYPALPFFALADAHESLGPHLSHVARRGYLGVHVDFCAGSRDRPASPHREASHRSRRTWMTSWSKIAEEKGIRYFMVSFTDLRGVQRAKLVPAAAIDRIAAEGAGFAGFATWLDMTPADPDMLAMADLASLIQLPWKPEVAWVRERARDERPSRRAGAALGARAADPARQGARARGQDGRRVRVLRAHRGRRGRG